MIISYLLEEEDDDECILTATCHMAEGAEKWTTIYLRTFWDDQLRGEKTAAFYSCGFPQGDARLQHHSALPIRLSPELHWGRKHCSGLPSQVTC